MRMTMITEVSAKSVAHLKLCITEKKKRLPYRSTETAIPASHALIRGGISACVV